MPASSVSLPAFAGPLSTLVLTLGWDVRAQVSVEEPILEQARALDRFLASIEKRAFRMARIALRHDEDALDSVQDAMLQLARRYGRRPSEEWRPLFYRILQNRIRDYQRRRRVQARIMAWLPGLKSQDDAAAAAADEYAAVPDRAPLPAEQLAADQAMRALERSLAELPGRQQEAFMLRAFEGMDVAQTAAAMGCSEGSVKTHYSRAVHTLREQLGVAW
jgi:RNA polymerase sigma-70 factor, ECF subfamily